MSRDYGRKYAGSRWQVYAMLEPLGWVSWRELHAMCQGYSARLRELRRLGYLIALRPDPSGDGQLYRLVSTIPFLPLGKRVKLYIPEEEVEGLILGEVSDTVVEIAAVALAIFKANKHKL